MLQVHYRLFYCAPYVLVDPTLPPLNSIRMECYLFLDALPYPDEKPDRKRPSILMDHLLRPHYIPQSDAQANGTFPFLLSLTIVDRILSQYLTTDEWENEKHQTAHWIRKCVQAEDAEQAGADEKEVAAMLSFLSNPHTSSSPPSSSCSSSSSESTSDSVSSSSAPFTAVSLIRSTFGTDFLQPPVTVPPGPSKPMHMHAYVQCHVDAAASGSLLVASPSRSSRSSRSASMTCARACTWTSTSTSTSTSPSTSSTSTVSHPSIATAHVHMHDVQPPPLHVQPLPNLSNPGPVQCHARTLRSTARKRTFIDSFVESLPPAKKTNIPTINHPRQHERNVSKR
jgi:hypothetical protein